MGHTHVFEVGDIVRIRQSGGGLGPTLWEITDTGTAGLVMIRERHPHIQYKPQVFHASGLALVPKPDTSHLSDAMRWR
jgi:hypothetical protein